MVMLAALLIALLFYETHELVCEIISVSEKRMKKCIVIFWTIFEKNDEGGLFPLSNSYVISFSGVHPLQSTPL